MDCIFCKIIKGEMNSYTLYEDDVVKVFLDVHPEYPGHTLIIPKKHFSNFEDIEKDVLIHVMEVAKRMYSVINEKLSPDGIKFIQNNGIVQDIKHYHLHLIPVFKSDRDMSLDDVYNVLKIPNE